MIWCDLFITDKTGRRGLKATVPYDSRHGEERNLQRHLAQIKAGSPAYNDRATGKPLYDAATAKLMMSVNGDEPLDVNEVVDDDELARQLSE